MPLRALVLALLLTTACRSPAQAVGFGLLGGGAGLVAAGAAGSLKQCSPTPQPEMWQCRASVNVLFVAIGAAAVAAGASVLLVEAALEAKPAKSPGRPSSSPDGYALGIR